MSDFVIRPASAAEFAVAVEWAAAEGWNPGRDDLSAFHAADPQGFLMGWQDGEPVSSISVVRYGDDFGFLGFYIVTEDRRGQGIGIATWNAGMKHLAGRTVGLDGVVDQQDNYRRSGFRLAGRNIRHSGTPVPRNGAPSGVRFAAVDDACLEAAAMFDARHFPSDRATFARSWLNTRHGTGRQSLAAFKDGNIVGLGTIRRCRSGHKIGPLFAVAADIASGLFDALCTLVDDGSGVTLDTPEDNREAVALAYRAGLRPVFETARMYRGDVPDLPIGNIFGITTFELG